MKLTEAKLKKLILETLEESRRRDFDVTLPSRKPEDQPETQRFTVPKGYEVGKINQYPIGTTIRINKRDKQRSIELIIDAVEDTPDLDGVHLSTSVRSQHRWNGSRMLDKQPEHDEKYLYKDFSNEQMFEAIQAFLEKIKNL
tara:strand:- start:253 stop:678 length:426 start_codon:yes stop_codon:yes gene_type:complete